MKKTLCFALLLLLCLCLVPLTGAAEEFAENATPPTEGSAGATLADTIGSFFTDNADTLLGILTLVGSLLVAFFYKTGLLPLLRAGLGELKETARKNGEEVGRFIDATDEKLRAMEENVRAVLAAEEDVGQANARMESVSQALADARTERERIRAVLTAETELFFQLMQAVNLPQAQKDAMCDSFYRFKRLLAAEETGERRKEEAAE